MVHKPGKTLNLNFYSASIGVVEAGSAFAIVQSIGMKGVPLIVKAASGASAATVTRVARRAMSSKTKKSAKKDQ